MRFWSWLPLFLGFAFLLNSFFLVVFVTFYPAFFSPYQEILIRVNHYGEANFEGLFFIPLSVVFVAWFSWWEFKRLVAELD
jgi:hypothetical protein